MLDKQLDEANKSNSKKLTNNNEMNPLFSKEGEEEDQRQFLQPSSYGTSDTNKARTKRERSDGKIVSYRSSTRSKQKDNQHYVHDRSGSLFWDDLSHFKEGTIPHSVAVAITIAMVCGTAIHIYYTTLFYFLEYVWHTVPKKTELLPTSLEYLWIPIIIFTMSILVGLSVVILGEPGDLAYTIKCVHEKAYVELNHMIPMIVASIFSIIGAGSLGPEAPVVAMCACLSGFISLNIFKTKNRNVVRKHTLMGMAGALSAFFGEPLGGSLFALEINSRFGIEYFEHMIEAIFCGVLTLSVFRYLSHLEVGAVWVLGISKTSSSGPIPVQYVFLGFGIGILGACIAYAFTIFHFFVMKSFDAMNLLDNKYAILRAILGAIVITIIGLFIPQTLFWSEEEFEVIVTSAPSSELQHVFPTSGLIHFEIDCAYKALLLGIFKLIAISFTIAGGFRGGFIFPSFLAGAAFGRFFIYIFPTMFTNNNDEILVCLCFAASISVALTKTSLATTLILVNLSNEPNFLAPVLAASLTSLFLTSYMPFIKTQVSREDIDTSLFTLETSKWRNITSKVIEQIRTRQMSECEHEKKEYLRMSSIVLTDASEAIHLDHDDDEEEKKNTEKNDDNDDAKAALISPHGNNHTFRMSKVSKMGWFG